MCASARRPLALSSDCAMRQACPLGKPCILARISLGKGWGPREHKQVGEKSREGAWYHSGYAWCQEQLGRTHLREREWRVWVGWPLVRAA